MKVRLLVLLSLVVIMSSCAFGTRRPTLTYDPVTEQMNQNNIQMKVISFKDKRSSNVCGGVRNGYGVSCGKVIPENSVSNWVTEALVKELIRSGYTISNDENASNVIEGKVLDVACDAYFFYEGEVRIKVVLKKDSRVVLDKEYSAIKKSGLNIASTGSAYGNAMEATLREVMKKVVSDINNFMIR